MSVTHTIHEAGAPSTRAQQARGTKLDRSSWQPRHPGSDRDQIRVRTEKTLNAFDRSRTFRDRLPGLGSLPSSSPFAAYPSMPLTPPDDPSPLKTLRPIKMNRSAFASILSSLSDKHFAAEARVAFVWNDLLGTVTDANSMCRNTMEEEAAASKDDVPTYMTYAVCTRADWLPMHNTVNLILHNDREVSHEDLSSYATWRPAISKMTRWLRERNHAYDSYLSQATYGIATSGKNFILVALYPGSRRAYGEPDEATGNVRVRSLLDSDDQEVLKTVLEDVSCSEAPRPALAITWLPLEVGWEEDASRINEERRNSRSEKQKPAIAAMIRNKAGG